jgi:methionyl-tRNA formyltransferase
LGQQIKMRIFITAGFDRAPNAYALCEMLSRCGHEIVGICVVTPFNWKRLQGKLRQQGPQIIIKSLRRIIGISKGASREAAQRPLECFLERNKIEVSSLKKWAAAQQVDYRVAKSLNDTDSIDFLKASRSDVLLYGGGGILRKEFIRAANGKILNAHSGPLPEIRGMNACEWSMLLGLHPHTTIHYINEGIDTGGYLAQIPVPLMPGDTVEVMREKCVVAGIQGLIDSVERLDELKTVHVDDPSEHRQCYVMAPVIRELLDLRLETGELKIETTAR